MKNLLILFAGILIGGLLSYVLINKPNPVSIDKHKKIYPQNIIDKFIAIKDTITIQEEKRITPIDSAEAAEGVILYHLIQSANSDLLQKPYSYLLDGEEISKVLGPTINSKAFLRIHPSVILVDGKYSVRLILSKETMAVNGNGKEEFVNENKFFEYMRVCPPTCSKNDLIGCDNLEKITGVKCN